MTPVDNSARLLRGVAGFEATKGAVALAAAVGLVSLMHHDLHHAAAALIGHIGLSPGDHYPAMALGAVDEWLSADRRSLLLAASGYAALRFTEAYGLWHARPWGERMGAVSGALYLPFELQHLVHRPNLISVGVVAVNLLLVGFLVWRLRRRAAVLPALPMAGAQAVASQAVASQEAAAQTVASQPVDLLHDICQTAQPALPQAVREPRAP